MDEFLAEPQQGQLARHFAGGFITTPLMSETLRQRSLQIEVLHKGSVVNNSRKTSNHGTTDGDRMDGNDMESSYGLYQGRSGLR